MITASTDTWPRQRMILFRFSFLFVMLFMLTLSFPHPYIPDLPGMLGRWFEPLVKWVGDRILQLSRPYAPEILSDSTGLYIHLLILFVISLTGTLAWTIFSKRSSHPLLLRLFITVVTYYLAFHLLVYGFNKIFKWQFYIPEPNILFTTLGDTPRDLLYWSTMGSSHSYNIFLGTLEVAAAILLFIRKTRLLGALLAAGIMLNIVMINFSFDISVKLFSLFLLLLCLVIIAPHAGALKRFFINAGPSVPGSYYLAVTPGRRKIYQGVKVLIILFLCWSVLSTYIQSGNFNDDRQPRPAFHGAYEVETFVLNGDTLPPLLTDTFRFRRMFIHRRGYLIIQNMQDQMKDYLFRVVTALKRWYYENERTGAKGFFTYRETGDGEMELTSDNGSNRIEIRLKKIDLSRLPLLRREFNWTMD